MARQAIVLLIFGGLLQMATPFRISEEEGRIRESMLELPSGVKLSYAEIAGSDVQPALVLVHGYLDSWRSWSRVLPRLGLPSGQRVVAITLRGWGDSDKSGQYTVDSYAKDVVAALRVLSIDKAVLGGHSMGTLISTAVAARHPGLVAGLVLCGAAAKMDPDYVVDPGDGTTFRDIGDLVLTFDSPDTVDKEFLKGFQLADLEPFIAKGILDAEFGDQVMNETLKADVRAYGEAWKSMLDEDHAKELPDIEVPTLILWGTKDGVFPEAEQRRLEKALSSSHVKQINIDDAPHAVIWTNADDVAKHTSDFLETLSSHSLNTGLESLESHKAKSWKYTPWQVNAAVGPATFRQQVPPLSSRRAQTPPKASRSCCWGAHSSHHAIAQLLMGAMFAMMAGSAAGPEE